MEESLSLSAAGRDAAEGDERTTVATSKAENLFMVISLFDKNDPEELPLWKAARKEVVATVATSECSALLFHEMHGARIFEDVYECEADCLRPISDNSLITRLHLAFQPSWLNLVDPFDTAAVAGVPVVAARRGVAAVPAVPSPLPAVPGPPELKFLHLTTWAAFLTEGARQFKGQEACLLGRTFALLSHRARDSTRRIGVSDTPAQVARHAPSYLAICMAVMQVTLAGPCGTSVACEAELRDGQTLLRGREIESASMLCVAQVVEGILESHATTAGAMEQREFERAVNAPSFLAAYEAMKNAEGVAMSDAA
ncbi:MAG: hypothetical protein SGPRY_000349 [Prymnesium sp.]